MRICRKAGIGRDAGRYSVKAIFLAWHRRRKQAHRRVRMAAKWGGEKWARQWRRSAGRLEQ